MPKNKNDDIFAPLRDYNAIEIADKIIDDNPILGTFKQLLDKMKEVDIKKLFSDLLETLTDKDFYNKLFNALKAYVEDHPWRVAMFIIGVILMTNPIGLLGFGTLGPVAGSIAAAWQSSIGGAVAAGSAFGILQGLGMTYSVAIPAAGAAMAGGAVADAIADGASKAKKEMDHQAEEAGKVTEDMGKGAQNVTNDVGNAFDDMGKGAQDAADNVGKAFDDMGKGIQNMMGG